MSTKFQTPVIIDAIRSPIGVKRGEMKGIRPDDLGAQILKALMARNKALPREKIEDIVVGCAFPEGSQGMLMARGIGILAGFPIETGGKVVNRFCGSSMDAVHQIDNAITVGDYDAAIAAGAENMFSVPLGGFNPSYNPKLAEKNYYISMGETAENLARDLNISREEQEEFSIASHRKALAAWENGKFKNEVIPVEYNGKTISRDEGPREPDLEKIRSLKPAFMENGTVTAATSSPYSVGSAAILLTSTAIAKEYGLKPRARLISRAFAGVPWDRMGMGPLPATEKALKKAGMNIDDMDAIELNEAFAAQSLYVIKKGNWPQEKVNIHGGAIAMGHPLGCSGVRIMTTLLNVLDDIDGRFGLATMCIGTGQGIATIIERI